MPPRKTEQHLKSMFLASENKNSSNPRGVFIFWECVFEFREGVFIFREERGRWRREEAGGVIQKGGGFNWKVCVCVCLVQKVCVCVIEKGVCIS